MKGLDVFIVRIMPFILFLIFGINLLCCWLRIDISVMYKVHGNSALYALSMYLISLSNKKYHCKWNRAMYLFLIAVPIFNFTDAVFDYVPPGDIYLAVVSIVFALTAIWTACMATRHFVSNHRKRRANGSNLQ